MKRIHNIIGKYIFNPYICSGKQITIFRGRTSKRYLRIETKLTNNFGNLDSSLLIFGKARDCNANLRLGIAQLRVLLSRYGPIFN
jgi:hypothetical protein